MKTLFKSLILSLILFTVNVPALAVPPELPKITIIDIKIQKLTKYISKTYKISLDHSEHIVVTAFNYGYHASFPTPIDILAIIAIESRFDKNVTSHTKDKGLMQISYKPTVFDVETNMYDGVSLLRTNSEQLKHHDAAIQAYNIGVPGYKKGRRNLIYLNRFKAAKAKLEAL